MAKVAFRCTGTLRDGSTCGKLVPAEVAGDNPVPSKCPVCGQGTKVDPDTGRWLPVEGHWQVLSELDDGSFAEHTAYYGITRDDVEEHPVKEWPSFFPGAVTQQIEVAADEAPATQDVAS